MMPRWAIEDWRLRRGAALVAAFVAWTGAAGAPLDPNHPDWTVDVRKCHQAIRLQYAYLQPTYHDAVVDVTPDGAFTVRSEVRLSDSFIAAPVGVMECRGRPGQYPENFLVVKLAQ